MATRITSRLLIFLCVATALLVVGAQPLLCLLFTFLVPFWFFLTAIAVAPVPGYRQIHRTLPFLSLPVFSPRPPPVS